MRSGPTVFLLLVFALWYSETPLTASEPAANTSERTESARNAHESPAQRHWAFQPLRETEPPAVHSPSRVALSPIDRFIFARLTAAGLSPAPPAHRSTLVRRVYFDLLGLPPTPEETEAFVQDADPDALGRLVDRLLASPHYGERWGRWWLDLARYADSNGQDENKFMANAWRYRDWVIRAFNANLPFDQFIVEQLAGDLLPTNGVSERLLFDRWTATGLLVLGPKMLAEQDKPKLVMDLVDEQIDVVTRAFLGLTVSCARCHDHKFDPISARDYYALAGIFKSTRAMQNLEFVSKFNERQIATREQLAALADYEQALRAKNRELEEAIQHANAALLSTWESAFSVELAAATQGGVVSDDSRDESPGLDLHRLQRIADLTAPDPATNRVSRLLRELAADPERLATVVNEFKSAAAAAPAVPLAPGKIGGAFRATGSNYLELAHSAALDPEQLTVEAWVWTPQFPGEGDLRRWLVNKNGNEWVEGHYALVLDQNRPGAYLNIGDGRENMFAVWSDGPKLETNRWHHLAFTYDGDLLRLFVDGQPAGETTIQRPRQAGTSPLALGRRQDGYVNFRGRLDEVRVFNRPLTPTEIAHQFAHPEEAADEGVVAGWEFNELTDAEQLALSQAEVEEILFAPGGLLALPADPRPLYPTHTREALTRLEQERDRLQASAPPPPAFALAVTEDQIEDLPVFVRGNHLSPGPEPVPRGFIGVACQSASPPLPTDQSGRLELARWLTDPEHPLTARVLVNRVWQAHFGEGLVRTPDNFGLRGEAPTHPELLDWLAREFIRSGWDLKHLHRLILNSATYQQASRSPEPESKALRLSQTPTAAMNPDPDNRWLAQFPRQRLEAEMVRDALLAVSGRLDTTTGGSLVDWKNDDYVPKDQVSETSVRRSVYLPVVRDRVYDVFTIFDFANPSMGTAKRTPTVVSHQALFFLNSPLVKECSRVFAQSLLAASDLDDPGRIRRAYEQALGRRPTEQETLRALNFLTATGSEAGAEARGQSWMAFCQTLFAANEFLYLD